MRLRQLATALPWSCPSVAPGSVAFIENRVPHRFRRVAETLQVLVVLAR